MSWIGAALAVAIAAVVIGGSDDVAPRTAPESDRRPIVKPVVAASAVSAAAETAERTFAPSPADAMARPQVPAQAPTPARLAEVEHAVMRLRERGASDDDAYRLRALSLNPETAARIAERESAERAWQHRVAAYLEQRNRLLAAGDKHSEAEQSAQLMSLRNAHFHPDEHSLLAAVEPAAHPRLVTE